MASAPAARRTAAPAGARRAHHGGDVGDGAGVVVGRGGDALDVQRHRRPRQLHAGGGRPAIGPLAGSGWLPPQPPGLPLLPARRSGGEQLLLSRRVQPQEQAAARLLVLVLQPGTTDVLLLEDVEQGRAVAAGGGVPGDRVVVVVVVVPRLQVRSPPASPAPSALQLASNFKAGRGRDGGASRRRPRQTEILFGRSATPPVPTALLQGPRSRRWREAHCGLVGPGTLFYFDEFFSKFFIFQARPPSRGRGRAGRGWPPPPGTRAPGCGSRCCGAPGRCAPRPAADRADRGKPPLPWGTPPRPRPRPP